MKTGEFFRNLLASGGEVSSKRFAGLLLVGTAIAGAIISYVNVNFAEAAEGMAKTVLYVGSGLLGANVVETVFTNVKRSQTITKDEN